MVSNAKRWGTPGTIQRLGAFLTAELHCCSTTAATESSCKLLCSLDHVGIFDLTPHSPYNVSSSSTTCYAPQP